MKVIRNIEDVAFNPQTVVTIGSFDGVHLGHRAILRYVIDRTKQVSGRSVVITFDPHPRDVVGKGPVEHLCTLEERLDHLAQEGIDETVIVRFTYEFSQITARTFYEEYLVKRAGVNEVVVGHDHLFGRNREGGIEEVRQLASLFGFNVMIIPEVSCGEKVVSSSLIRKSLSRGEVELATEYLGRRYSITAQVMEGDKRGRQLGFPTANLSYDRTKKITPSPGVYVVKVAIEGSEYYGMLNIGVRPTFNTNGQQFVEVHLFDFQQEIYGSTVTVSFIRRLRSEQQFNSKDELVARLQQDRLDSLTYVSTIH